MDLAKLLNNFQKNPEPKYYIIGVWLVSDSYTKDGFLVDMVVSKGYGCEDAIKNLKDYESSFRKIKKEYYLPLTVGDTVLKATMNSKEIYDLLHRKNAMPDNKRIQELYKEVLSKE